jgi:Zn-finger nucleic acid-binding protein
MADLFEMIMRNCPKCKIPMPSSTLRVQEIERCEECNGTFFDKGELDSIINLIEIYRSVELDELDVSIENTERVPYLCPSDSSEMLRKEYPGAILDECSKCAGLWLDDGEISSLNATAIHIKNNLNLYLRLGE